MAMAYQIQEVVPRATFVENVSDFVKDKDVDTVLRDVQANLQRYKHVEAEIAQRRQRLAVKQPEIEKCLDAVNLLIERRESDEEVGYFGVCDTVPWFMKAWVEKEAVVKMQTTILDFSLSDQVYARAKIDTVDSVGLWLGAGVMVEYALEEAKSLLEQQLDGCKKQLEMLKDDYEYVKDQVTTTEVCLARIYNYSVETRRRT
eukprot:jgi/Picsp_1/5327/NSC_02688-R1_prefoldin subunit 3